MKMLKSETVFQLTAEAKSHEQEQAFSETVKTFPKGAQAPILRLNAGNPKFQIQGTQDELEPLHQKFKEANITSYITPTNRFIETIIQEEIRKQAASSPHGVKKNIIQEKVFPLHGNHGGHTYLQEETQNTLFQKGFIELVKEKTILETKQDHWLLDPKKDPEIWELAKPMREANSLLIFLKEYQKETRTLLKETTSHWGGEDPFYRYLHQSFKLYHTQESTEAILRLLNKIGEKAFGEFQPNPKLKSIFRKGTGKLFDLDHNNAWEDQAKPILDAFLYSREILRFAVKYAKELKEAPQILPSGWASVLYYYGKR